MAALTVSGAGGEGIGLWFHAGPDGCTKLITPFVSTQAVVYFLAVQPNAERQRHLMVASSPDNHRSVWSAAIHVVGPAVQV
jgi:hypothetical protein